MNEVCPGDLSTSPVLQAMDLTPTPGIDLTPINISKAQRVDSIEKGQPAASASPLVIDTFQAATGSGNRESNRLVGLASHEGERSLTPQRVKENIVTRKQ